MGVGVVHEEMGQGSSWKSEPEGKKLKKKKNWRAWRHLMSRERWCWSRRNRITTSEKANEPKTSISIPC